MLVDFVQHFVLQVHHFGLFLHYFLYELAQVLLQGAQLLVAKQQILIVLFQKQGVVRFSLLCLADVQEIKHLLYPLMVKEVDAQLVRHFVHLRVAAVQHLLQTAALLV